MLRALALLALLVALALPAACGSQGGFCGDEDAIASDEPIEIEARGVDCDTARKVAYAATVDGAQRPEGFDCTRVNTVAEPGVRQRCTRGDAEVSWLIQQA